MQPALTRSDEEQEGFGREDCAPEQAVSDSSIGERLQWRGCGIVKPTLTTEAMTGDEAYADDGGYDDVYEEAGDYGDDF